MSEFEGDVAIVTGGASGIGRATAVLLHSRGARVVIADIGKRGAQELAAELGEGTAAVEVDVSDSESVQRMVATTHETFGRLDILCNNAGFGFRGTVATIAEDEWDRLMNVNLRGVFLCSKYALPLLVESGNGRIVNTSSYTSLVGIADRAAYVASKGGITALTRAMAIDHVSDGIRVNAVAPGVIWTEFHADPERPAKLATGIPLGRSGRPDEIAAAVVWLLSDEASYTSGTVLRVAGGR
jgi:meso-butanediol dehydrogenase/(S,S)-butanediol dehydrogenase/diacetyl reductase